MAHGARGDERLGGGWTDFSLVVGEAKEGIRRNSCRRKALFLRLSLRARQLAALCYQKRAISAFADKRVDTAKATKSNNRVSRIVGLNTRMAGGAREQEVMRAAAPPLMHA